MLLKSIPWIIGLLIVGFHIDYCQMTSQSSESDEISTGLIDPVINQEQQPAEKRRVRVRRQDQNSYSNSDTASTVLSILPLDRIGTIVGQIMSTGLKEMMSPDVGKKIVNVLENQAPLLLTSLFTNLYSNLRAPPKAGVKMPTPVTESKTTQVSPLLSNSSSPLFNALRNSKNK